MDDNFLVMGAGGVIGGRVFRLLKAAGRRVKGASRSKTGPDWVKLDLLDPSGHDAAFSGVNTVMLMSRPGDEKAAIYAAPLLASMVRSGVRRVVVLSALGAQARPDFSIRKVELLVERSGLAWTFVRPNFFMQMLAAPPFSTEIKGRGTLSLPLGPARIAYVDASDVAAVIVRALTDPGLSGQGIDVNGPEALDHYEVAAEISRGVGHAVKYVHLSDKEARSRLSRNGFREPQIERLMGFYSLVRQGHCAVPDSDVADLLERPLVKFRDFVKASVGAWG